MSDDQDRARHGLNEFAPACNEQTGAVEAGGKPTTHTKEIDL